ncbi:MAG: DUF58 domain-containing protein [Myxococcaceae bacterium]
MGWSSSFSTPAASSPRRLLEPPLLAALLGLSLPVHRIRGALSGMHPGSGPGPGEDFFQHRPYAAGEDVRAVDWRASARLGHLLVKERHRPLRQPLVLLLDGSDSMGFPPGRNSKRHRARQLAAALALLALRRGDPVRLDVLTEGGFLPTARALPGAGAAARAEALLGQEGTAGQADVARALHRLSADELSAKHAVLLSDLYGDTALLQRGLERLVHAGAAVTVLHLLSERDVRLPAGTRAVRDVESGETLAVGHPEAQQLPLRVQAWKRALRALAERAGAEWVSVEAEANPAVALRRWLGGRRG